MPREESGVGSLRPSPVAGPRVRPTRLVRFHPQPVSNNPPHAVYSPPHERTTHPTRRAPVIQLPVRRHHRVDDPPRLRFHSPGKPGPHAPQHQQGVPPQRHGGGHSRLSPQGRDDAPGPPCRLVAFQAKSQASHYHHLRGGRAAGAPARMVPLLLFAPHRPSHVRHHNGSAGARSSHARPSMGPSPER